jgi:hypothetical protein
MKCHLKLEGSTGYMQPLPKTSAKEEILTKYEATHQVWKKCNRSKEKNMSNQTT